MLSTNEKRVCPFSITEFTPKRKNQIYASKDCRIAFNNEKQTALRKKLSPINKSLIINYKILDEILLNETSIIVHEQFLRGKNFSFKVFTHLVVSGNSYAYGLFNCSYFKVDKENYKISRLW